MKSQFISAFASQIVEMLEFKEALGYSKSSYFKFLLNFDRFCSDAYPGQNKLTQEIVSHWAVAKPNEGAAGVTRRLIAIREFGKYLASSGTDAYVIPTELIGGFKKFMPYIYTDEELAKFFYGADNLPPHKNSPLREFTAPVLFRLMYCCGLRPSEVRLLKRSEVDFKESLLFISESKSYKDRIVPVDMGVMAICEKYDGIANIMYPDRKYFFQNPNGEAYTALWIQNIFHKCWLHSGVSFTRSQRPRVMDFRHNYATRTFMNWLDEGKDINALMPYLSAYMGHSEFKYTAYYIRLIPDRLLKSGGVQWERLNALVPEVHEHEI
jgi:integrase